MNKNIIINYQTIYQDDPVPFYDLHQPNQRISIYVIDDEDEIRIYPSEIHGLCESITIPANTPAWEINNIMDLIRDRIAENVGTPIEDIDFADIQEDAETRVAVPINHISEWWTANTHAVDVTDEEIIEDCKKGYLHADDCIIFFPYHVDRYLQQLHDAQEWEQDNYI